MNLDKMLNSSGSWSVDVSTEEISGGQKQPEVTDADSG